MSFLKKYSKEVIIVFLFLLSAFLWYATSWNSENVLSVYFLDIGQGDAVFIKSPTGRKMLIDGGPDRSVLKELSKILPFYDRKIDVVLATHPDKDHIGGLVEVLKRFKSDFIFDPDNPADTRFYNSWTELASKSKAQKLVAKRGMVLHLGGGTKFVILFPDRDVSKINSNDASIIGKLVFGSTAFILTGDSPRKIEEYLVSLDGDLLQSQVLKAGHHGSKTSNAESFVETVAPEYVVIQAGKGNSYGHPHQESLDVFNKAKTKILGNYDYGTILMKSDGKNLVVN